MAKIYTRTGDAGETSLLGGGRVRKDHLRIEAVGAIDETNAAVGIVRMELVRGGVAPAEMDEVLAGVQHRLFDLGAEVAAPRPLKQNLGWLRREDIAVLEAAIDRFETALAPLRAFILPGGCAAAAQLHLARCVCRRAERRLVQLAATAPLRGEIVGYLNRLSDLLFVFARAANQANRVPDTLWEQRSEG